MRALTVSAWGKAPTLSNIPKAPPTEGTSQIHILASGLPQLVRSQASGTHYSVTNAPLPYTPGIDGVGYTSEGKLVYFNLLANKPQGGGFAEYANPISRTLTPIPLPTDVSEPQARNTGVKVASLINPTLSSWMALRYRARIDDFTGSGTPFTVLILGATSTSGRIAALLSRQLGAKRVIGVARDASALSQLKSRGTLDDTITLDSEDVSKTDFSLLSDPANLENGTFPLVVLDYIYGPTALALMSALPSAASQAENLEVRWVHIGTLGREAEIALPGPLLRGKNVTISGAGPGSWSVKALARENADMVKAIVEVVPDQGWQEEYGVVQRRLEDVEAAWADLKSRSVFVMQ